jgi:SAM-dependent methyltransferase
VDALHDWRQPGLPSVDDDDREFKARVRTHYDRLAAQRDRWYRRNRRYHDYLEHALGALVEPGQSVLELGCGTGNLLKALRPGRGVGIDLSPAMVDLSRQKYPELRFEIQDAEVIDHAALSTSEAAYGDEPFDVIVASDLIGELLDVTAMLERLHGLSSPETRLILTFHNPALEGVLRAAQRMGLTMPPSRQNWIGPHDIGGLLALSDFVVERVHTGLLLPALLPTLDRVADVVPDT